MQAAVRNRLLGEMLGSVMGPGEDWKVLVMDATTLELFSSACKMSDLLEYQISLAEDLNRKRQPQPSQDVVYFISPQSDSIKRMCDDFAKVPMYRQVHIFLSSSLSPSGMEQIQAAPNLKSRIRSFKEVNMEIRLVGSRTFHTSQPDALTVLLGQDCGQNRQRFDREVSLAARRLVTACLSLKVYPSVVRYYQPTDLPQIPGAAERGSVAEKVAEHFQRFLHKYQDKIGDRTMFGGECEVLILDRSVDPIAPVIHGWTYEGALFDLVPHHDGAVFSYTPEDGKQVDVRIDESDSVFAEVRHEHVATASNTLHTQLKEFTEKNRIARARLAGLVNDSSNLSNRTTESLPEFNEMRRRLGIHIELVERVFAAIKSRELLKLGVLEEALVYGESSTKEMINYFAATSETFHSATPTATDKVRALMCWLTINQQKMEAGNQANWMKLGKLTREHMRTVCNLQYLGVHIVKKDGEQKRGLLGKFGKKKNAAKVRKQRSSSANDTLACGNFTPRIADIVDAITANRLDESEFPHAIGSFSGMAATTVPTARSVRTRPDTKPTWVRRDNAGAGSSGADSSRRTLLVFMVGGLALAEVRVAHQLSREYGMEVYLGGTSMDLPEEFVNKVANLSSPTMSSLEIQ